MDDYRQKQGVLFEQLKKAEAAYEAACGCGCVCHTVKVGHMYRCCYASMNLREEIKEDITKIHAEIRRLENGRVG